MGETSILLIQAMQPADWLSVRAIYQQGIDSGHATFETQTPSWEGWDQSHHPFGRLVARLNGDIVGWAALSPVSRRAVYAGVAEVSVYVAETQRARGVGRALLQALILESLEHGVWTLQASIFPENEASVTLHQRCGFRVVGRRERLAKQFGVWRDVLLLERRSQLT
jgi:phosphinothricin acetyltransferase